MRRCASCWSALEATYCGAIGFEYAYMSDSAQVEWLRQRIEAGRGRAVLNEAEQRQILQALTAAEGLERYLHRRYVGQKRFSLEGGDGLIPVLDEIVRRAGAADVKELVIGMAHRGRLNVLVNILGKQPRELFAEFEGKAAGHRFRRRQVSPGLLGRSDHARRADPPDAGLQPVAP